MCLDSAFMIGPSTQVRGGCVVVLVRGRSMARELVIEDLLVASCTALASNCAYTGIRPPARAIGRRRASSERPSWPAEGSRALWVSLSATTSIASIACLPGLAARSPCGSLLISTSSSLPSLARWYRRPPRAVARQRRISSIQLRRVAGYRAVGTSACARSHRPRGRRVACQERVDAKERRAVVLHCPAPSESDPHRGLLAHERSEVRSRAGQVAVLTPAEVATWGRTSSTTSPRPATTRG